MSAEKNKAPNRLIGEKSPYLLQHAHNPVDWYPWGEEAFAKAKAEDKPVFLSIGYSTCHWCHVMERESFEDAEVAALLNRHFVCVKVDREERPDVDRIYMEVCQRLTGSGGWPLSIFMDADKQPFFAGTYFPKGSGMGIPGFMQLLDNIALIWQNDRAELTRASDQIAAALEQDGGVSMPVDKGIPQTAFRHLKQSFDRRYGGFSYAPKFPTPHNLLFLLRRYVTDGDADALAMCEKTLDAMRRGGVFDQIGFGFSRYSTDQRWLVPHFEKMLYDNALLCMAYAECWQVTGKKTYAETAREIVAYLTDRLLSEEGRLLHGGGRRFRGNRGQILCLFRRRDRRGPGRRCRRVLSLFQRHRTGQFRGEKHPQPDRNRNPRRPPGVHGGVQARALRLSRKARAALSGR